MSLILNGTTGISDVDGTAAAPALTGTDTNTGIFFPAADTIAFAEGGVEAARFDSAGNLGIGVVPSAWGSTKALQFDYGSFAASGSIGLNVAGNAFYNGTNWIYRATGSAFNYAQTSSGHLWYNAASGTAGDTISFTQAMTLDSSGRVLINTTTADNNYQVKIDGNAAARSPLRCSMDSTSSVTQVGFFNPNGAVGSISTSGSSTSFNTSSDYRLKEDIVLMAGALAKVTQLKPCTYKWKVDGSDGQGFIAHELQAVVPECVSGEKDAVDADGNPKYQGIDTSFLVATLTAAIQEQQALITALTTRITALEAA